MCQPLSSIQSNEIKKNDPVVTFLPPASPGLPQLGPCQFPSLSSPSPPPSSSCCPFKCTPCSQAPSTCHLCLQPTTTMRCLLSLVLGLLALEVALAQDLASISSGSPGGTQVTSLLTLPSACHCCPVTLLQERGGESQRAQPAWARDNREATVPRGEVPRIGAR